MLCTLPREAKLDYMNIRNTERDGAGGKRRGAQRNSEKAAHQIEQQRENLPVILVAIQSVKEIKLKPFNFVCLS